MPDQLLSKLETDARATLDAYYQPLKESKRQEVEDKKQELENIERQYQEALEHIRSWLNGQKDEASTASLSVGQQAPNVYGEESAAQQNGSSPHRSSKLPTRRTMVLEALPSFKGQEFIRRDLEAKIIERWPEVEPTTEAEQKSFTSRIAHLLTDLVKKGQIESTKGENSFDPRVYRVKEVQEEELTLKP